MRRCRFLPYGSEPLQALSVPYEIVRAGSQWLTMCLTCEVKNLAHQQKGDPQYRPIINLLTTGMLLSDRKMTEHLLHSYNEYFIQGGVFYHVWVRPRRGNRFERSHVQIAVPKSLIKPELGEARKQTGNTVQISAIVGKVYFATNLEHIDKFTYLITCLCVFVLYLCFKASNLIMFHLDTSN